MTWTERETIDYNLEELPFDSEGKLAIIDPSRIRVKLSGYVYPVDFGAWCYTKRTKPYKDTTSSKCSIYKVNAESFRKKRVAFVAGYIDFIYGQYKMGKSLATINSTVMQFKRFVDWCDKNYVTAFDSKEYVKQAVDMFSNELIREAQQGLININTGASYQLVVITALRGIYNDKKGNLFEGIRRIRRSHTATNVTLPPQSDHAAETLVIYTAIFEQLSDFILNFKFYPSLLRLPQGDYWFFPNARPFVSKGRLVERDSWPSGYWAYNYAKGRLNTKEEILERIQVKFPQQAKTYAKKVRSEAVRKLSEANDNRYHGRRILVATLAQQAFIMLFAANTGMGLGQIANLRWGDDDFEISKDRQGFKTIKQRAGNIEVNFLITASFVKPFRQYLRLRRYLLGIDSGQTCDFLFFRLMRGEFRKLSMDASYHFNERLQRLFDVEVLINTRQWRAHKSDWLIKNTDISTTAMILQNTPSTVLKHYIEGSEQEASVELGNYFEVFNTKVVIRNKRQSRSTSVGQCVLSDTPSPVSKSIPIEPDCLKPEGCLFCENYAVHADVEDLRKLFSLKYVIHETEHLASSMKHFHEVYGGILSRLDNVVEQIMATKRLSKSKIKDVKREVFDNEILSPYWDRKLKMLVDLELLV